MDDEQQRIKDNFADNLKAEDYLQVITWYWTEIPELFRFMLMFINDELRSGRFKGSKLLEIGSGATVHSIATASAFFPNITLSDYVEDNLVNLKLWLQGNSKLKQLLEVPAGLEGYGDNIQDGVKVLESRIQKTVKRVSRCDVLTDNILLDNNDPETSPPYDLIISCLCLETAPKDFDGYIDIMKRVNKLLRPGGGLLTCGFIQGGKWGNILQGGDQEFNHIQIGEGEILEALTKAGFGNITLKTRGREGLKELDYKFDKIYCCVSEKL